MTSLKAIKTRLSSVKSTLKITSAMKMVASAKLRKAQSVIAGKLPYEQSLHNILSMLLLDSNVRSALENELGMGVKSHPLVERHDDGTDIIPMKDKCGRVAIVVFSSNSSLCGAFNTDVVREYHHLVQVLFKNGYSSEDIDIYAIGRKIADAVKKDGFKLCGEGDYYEMAEKPNYDAASALASHLVKRFVSGEVGQVMLVYSHFESSVSQPVVRESYLPMSFSHPEVNLNDIEYIIEPDPITVVKSLLPKVLMLKIYTVLLDANAAEHAARTVAMQIASDNAQKLITELTLAYNKGRQSEITSEILDLIGGAMS